MKNNIVLIGFMGAGKSLVANILSKSLKLPYVSTDELIEKKAGKTVSEIFQSQGEELFRQIEKEVVFEVAKKDRLIVDCGGGAILDPQNMKALKKKGTLFYLKTSPSVIFQRLKDQKNRPLLQVQDPLARIKDLLQQRIALYEQADYTIVTDQQTVEQTARAVISLLQQAD